MSIALPNSATTRRSDLQAEKLAQTRATRLAQAAYGAELSTSQYAKPAGLINEGNTCFFNSTFQALAASRSLINLLAPVIVPTKGASAAAGGGDESAEKTQADENDSGTPQPPTPLVADPQISLHSPYPPVSVSTGAPADDPLATIQITPHAIPSLRDEALEPDTASLLPVTFAFERALGRAWKAKDAAVSALDHAEGEDGGAAAAAAAEQKSLSLKSLLRELARKYDQYDEYRQQDAHELLRHLLDSMSMEEKDVIKKLRPPPAAQLQEEGAGGGGRPRGSRRRTRGDSISKAHIEMAGELGQLAKGSMVPFADALFGGSLVSVVICEGCKNVSHTYEGFLDVSLSMREAAPRPRKRDKFRAIANKLRPGSGSKSRSSQSQGEGRSEAEGNGGTSTPTINLDGVHSEAPSGDDSTMFEDSALVDSASERSSVRDVTPTPLHSSAGPPATSAVKKRSSLSWGIRKPSKSGRSSSVESSETRRSTADSAALEGSLSSLPPLTATPRLPSGLSVASSTGASEHGSNGQDAGAADPTKPPRPSPAQAAYIRRILNGPNLPPKEDPLAKLRSGMANLHTGAAGNGPNNGHQLDQVPEEPASRRPTIDGLDTDLMDSLRTFTATEVLEGENAFACHRCWRYQTGRVKSAKRRTSAAADGDEDADEEEDDQPSPVSATTPVSAAALPVSASERSTTTASESSAASAVPNITLDGGVLTEEPAPVPGEHRRRVRLPVDAVDEHSLAAPSRAHRPSSSSGRSTGSIDSNGSTVSGSGYSTSSEDSSDEPGRARLTISRPTMPARRKSTHFVMRRAVKRYMFARAPPILVFHFKRFTQSGKHAATSMYMSTFASLKKIDDFASFPEMLDLGPFVAPKRSDYKEPPASALEAAGNGVTPARPRYLDHPPGDRGPAEPTPIRYRLYAVVVHVGASSLSGHYIAYVLVEPGAILKHLQPEHVQVQAHTQTDQQSSSPAAGVVGEGRDATQCGPDVEADLMAEPLAAAAASGEASKSSDGKARKDTRVWCYCSDQQVRLASLEEVLKAKAYLCFYEQC